MKHFLLTVGCIALLSACSGGFGSLGGSGNSSAGSGGSGALSNGSGSANSSGSGSFGSKRTEQAEVVETKPVDGRAFVSNIKSVRLDPAKGGKILRVIGEMGRVGYYDLELVLIDDFDSNVITYEARAAAPAIGQANPSIKSREVVLGTFISDRFRPSARTIVVQGLNRSVTVRR